MENTTEPMFARHAKFIVILLLILSIGIISLSIFYHQLTQPTKSTIVSTPNQTTPATLILNPKSFTNVYSTFNYPDIMSIRPPSAFSLPIVAKANFFYTDTLDWLLNIEIVNIPSGNLIDNSDYSLRINEPAIYELNETNIKGVNVPVMIDTSSGTFNKVAFLVNGQYQAVISLIGADPTGNTALDNCLQMVLSSWQWQM